MDIIQRNIKEELLSFLSIFPVVFVTGARQAGKTTLVREIGAERGYHSQTFDDEFPLQNARQDPSGWLRALPKPLIIDEVQRVPEIFLAIKKDVDQNRVPGRYLITGSANPLLLPKLGDSLAGRMGILTMFPFSMGELSRKKETFVSWIFSSEWSHEPIHSLKITEFKTVLLRGGFPAIQSFQHIKDVNRWVRAYLQTMMERDVRDISNIEGSREFPRLFRLLATRSGSLLNISDLSRSLGMVNVTINRYLKILETLYFIYLLPAWYTNLGKRLIKAPKLQICDTGILSQLLDIDQERLDLDSSLFAQFIENFVFSELLKQKSWSSIPFDLYHFRDGDHEVDFVLERPNGSLVGIEVKKAHMIRTEDLKGMKRLKEISKNKFHRGIFLHLGENIQFMGDDIWAVPLQALWG